MGQKISVIVPCYKQAEFLPETLNSIINQTYTDWECIIINDGSPDNTEEIAKYYCEKDNRFRYIYQKNGGLSSARNTGIDRLEGEYIQFLDSDDLLEPTKFTDSINLFMKTNAQIIITGVLYCKNDDINQELDSLTGRYYLKKNSYKDVLLNWDKEVTIPIHSIIYKKEVIINNQIYFDTSLPAKEDFDFHLCIFQTKPVIEYIPQKLCRYRVGHNSLSGNILKMLKGTYRVINRHYKKANYWNKVLILNNVGFRLTSIIYKSINDHVCFKECYYICKEEWKNDKSSIYLGLFFIPLGLFSKIIFKLKSKFVKK